MDQQVKNILYCMNCICDDNNMRNFKDLNGLIYPTPDHEEFSLSADDVDCMMDSLPNRIVVQVNICDRCGNLVFNTGIRNDYSQTTV